MKPKPKSLKELREVRQLVDWARAAREFMFKNPARGNYSLWKKAAKALQPFEDYNSK